MESKSKAQKAKENKEKLIESIIDDLWENIYDSQDYIKDLVRESLSRRTQKDLKQINA
jgi:hypothetical protein